MSVESVPKCCGCIILSASVISPSIRQIGRKTLTNVQKSPIPQWWKKWKIDPESTRGPESPPKVNRFFWWVTPCPCLPSLVDVRFRVRWLSCLIYRKTEWQTGFESGSVPKCCGCILSASVISPSMGLIGRWLYEKYTSLFTNMVAHKKKIQTYKQKAV